MKKTLITLAIVLVLAPSISYGASLAELEAMRLRLMEQVIVILKARVDELIALRKERPLATLGSPITSQRLTSAVIVKKKRSGGGGGSSRNQEVEAPAVTTPTVSEPEIVPVPLELTLEGARNEFRLRSNQVLNPTLVKLTGQSISMPVSEFISHVPSTLILRAGTSDGNIIEIPLDLDWSSFSYTAALDSRLAQGITYTGAFDIVVPPFFQSAEIEYSVLVETNGVTRTIALEYDGEIQDALSLHISPEDPDGSTIMLDEDNNTEALIFAFDLSAENSDTDVELGEIAIDVQANGSNISIDTLVSDFRLEIDGESYDAESYSGTGMVATLIFDIDGDYTIPMEEEVTVMLYADLENVEGIFPGATIVGSVSPNNIQSEGIDDITVEGYTVTGETHTLRTEGLIVEHIDDTITEYENADTTNTDDSVRFVLEFEVSAFGDNLYIPFGPTTTTGMTDGVKYRIVDSSNNVITPGSGNGTSTASLDVEDGAAEETNSYKITDDGETLVLTVDFDPVAAGSYRIEVTAINFATTDVATATQTQSLTDLDIRTGLVTIQQ